MIRLVAFVAALTAWPVSWASAEDESRDRVVSTASERIREAFALPAMGDLHAARRQATREREAAEALIGRLETIAVLTRDRIAALLSVEPDETTGSVPTPDPERPDLPSPPTLEAALEPARPVGEDDTTGSGEALPAVASIPVPTTRPRIDTPRGGPVGAAGRTSTRSAPNAKPRPAADAGRRTATVRRVPSSEEVPSRPARRPSLSPRPPTRPELPSDLAPTRPPA